MKHTSQTSQRHDPEGQGAKPRDHDHTAHRWWKHPHRDWRVWAVSILMIVMVLVYLMSGDLSWRPGRAPAQPTPAMNAP